MESRVSGEVIRATRCATWRSSKPMPRRTPLRPSATRPSQATRYSPSVRLWGEIPEHGHAGIVSANRTFEGLNYIQSDVSVNPGAAAGLCLDEQRRGVGMTEAGYSVGGAPLDINLFTPVATPSTS